MKDAFQPIFVVGYPRSGTTMLASFLGRHSNIAMPPETMFFFGSYQKAAEIHSPSELVKILQSSSRIRDLKLDYANVEAELGGGEVKVADLFRAALSEYARSENKTRAGEKTPLHLLWADTILSWYPTAKVICIMRDGRDVVTSISKVPWSHGNIYKHCYDWNKCAKEAKRLAQLYPQRFKVLKYEDLIANPSVELNGVMGFVGEAYEHEMLKESSSVTVPEWEMGWKSNALKAPDPKNSGKWQKEHPKKIVIMQSIMRAQLLSWGYSVPANPLFLRLSVLALSWQFHPLVRPYFSFVKRAFKGGNGGK